MSITVVPSVVTGQTYSAANYNTQVRDNINGIWVLTTAGDMLYATGATAANRLALVVGGILYGGASAPAWLAKPSVRSFLQNDSGGVPSWQTLFAINAKALKVYDAAIQDVTSTAYVDITNATQTITTTKTCTIVMIATGRMGTDSTTRDAYARPVINGSAPATDAGSAELASTGVGIFPFTVLHYVTGLAAGTYTCKLQGKISPTGGHVYFGTGTIMLLAIEE